jgi:hypothetical protein
MLPEQREYLLIGISRAELGIAMCECRAVTHHGRKYNVLSIEFEDGSGTSFNIVLQACSYSEPDKSFPRYKTCIRIKEREVNVVCKLTELE